MAAAAGSRGALARSAPPLSSGAAGSLHRVHCVGSRMQRMLSIIGYVNLHSVLIIHCLCLCFSPALP